jgi:hypothetical protein
MLCPINVWSTFVSQSCVQIASERVKSNHLLVARAMADHRQIIARAATYHVFWDEITEDYIAATVRSPAGSFLELSRRL